jgi:hypothetical protein
MTMVHWYYPVKKYITVITPFLLLSLTITADWLEAMARLSFSKAYPGPLWG